MNNSFDEKVKFLAQNDPEKMARGVEFIARVTDEKGEGEEPVRVGRIRFKRDERKVLAVYVSFLCAIQYRDWIFTLLQWREKGTPLSIGAIYQPGDMYYDLGPITDKDNALKEFCDFFDNKILEE